MDSSRELCWDSFGKIVKVHSTRMFQMIKIKNKLDFLLSKWDDAEFIIFYSLKNFKLLSSNLFIFPWIKMIAINIKLIWTNVIFSLFTRESISTLLDNKNIFIHFHLRAEQMNFLLLLLLFVESQEKCFS